MRGHSKCYELTTLLGSEKSRPTILPVTANIRTPGKTLLFRDWIPKWLNQRRSPDHKFCKYILHHIVFIYFFSSVIDAFSILQEYVVKACIEGRRAVIIV